MNDKYTPTSEVLEIGRLNFQGNTIPEFWYHHIKFPSGKPNLTAIVILAEIVYWYRPSEIREESSGRLLGHKKKFHADMLQRSYQALADKFGFSKKQAIEACHFLQEKGLISLNLRTVTINDVRCSNVLFIGVNPKEIEQISFAPPTLEVVTSPPGVENSNPPTLERGGSPPGGWEGMTSRVIASDPQVVTNTKTSTKNSQRLLNDRVTQQNSATNSGVSLHDTIACAVQTIDVFPEETRSEQSEPTSTNFSREAESQQTPSAKKLNLTEKTKVPAAKTSGKRKVKQSPELEAEAFQEFWEAYYAFCLDVGCSAGVRAEAVKEWDVLLPTIDLADLQEGTEYYCQKKREQFMTRGEAIGVSHGCRFLRNLKWKEALDYKQRGELPTMTPANRRAMQTYQGIMEAIKDL